MAARIVLVLTRPRAFRPNPPARCLQAPFFTKNNRRRHLHRRTKSAGPFFSTSFYEYGITVGDYNERRLWTISSSTGLAAENQVYRNNATVLFNDVTKTGRALLIEQPARSGCAFCPNDDRDAAGTLVRSANYVAFNPTTVPPRRATPTVGMEKPFCARAACLIGRHRFYKNRNSGRTVYFSPTVHRKIRKSPKPPAVMGSTACCRRPFYQRLACRNLYSPCDFPQPALLFRNNHERSPSPRRRSNLAAALKRSTSMVHGPHGPGHRPISALDGNPTSLRTPFLRVYTRRPSTINERQGSMFSRRHSSRKGSPVEDAASIDGARQSPDPRQRCNPIIFAVTGRPSPPRVLQDEYRTQRRGCSAIWVIGRFRKEFARPGRYGVRGPRHSSPPAFCACSGDFDKRWRRSKKRPSSTITTSRPRLLATNVVPLPPHWLQESSLTGGLTVEIAAPIGARRSTPHFYGRQSPSRRKSSHPVLRTSP